MNRLQCPITVSVREQNITNQLKTKRRNILHITTVGPLRRDKAATNHAQDGNGSNHENDQTNTTPEENQPGPRGKLAYSAHYGYRQRGKSKGENKEGTHRDDSAIVVE